MVINLNGFKAKDEVFIHGVEGTLRLDYILDTFYSFQPYPFYYGFTPIVSTTYIKCIFAATDKRILIIGKTPMDELDKNIVYSFNYTDIKVEFKKRLGSRMFTFDIDRQEIFNFSTSTITFEVSSANIQQAEFISDVIKTQWLLENNGLT
jgi:hypothetical protein